MKTLRVFLTIVSLGIIAISGCHLHPVEAISVSPTGTTTAVKGNIPEGNRTLHPIEQLAAPVRDESGACETNLSQPRHVVVADVDYTAHTVRVQQYTRFANQTDLTWEKVVFNLEPNRLRGVLIMEQIDPGQSSFSYTLNRQRLEIILAEPLAPGCEASVTLDYTLDVPAVGEQALASKGFFAYTERQLNLGYWLATVAVFQEGEWITREATSVGEQNVLENATWDVVINLINPPENLTIAAPGTVTQINANSWRYVHHHSRDFSLSLSDEFFLNGGETVTGVTVELYTFGRALKNGAADHALAVATRSLAMFSDLFGAYPYERMVVVQGDFPDGMEFSGLVFVGNRWFTQYEGDPACYLTLITAHEISHQWWYALVGNDAALTPWLDEALATYSEYIFLEEYYPDLKDWWWRFRVEQYNPTGHVDSAVYEFDSVRAYINAVYLRGAQMLHALREDLGTEAFFQFLADYAEAGNGTIATPALFWSVLTPEQIAQTQNTREHFLRQPQVESSEE